MKNTSPSTFATRSRSIRLSVCLPERRQVTQDQYISGTPTMRDIFLTKNHDAGEVNIFKKGYNGNGRLTSSLVSKQMLSGNQTINEGYEMMQALLESIRKANHTHPTYSPGCRYSSSPSFYISPR